MQACQKQREIATHTRETDQNMTVDTYLNTYLNAFSHILSKTEKDVIHVLGGGGGK